MFYSKNKGIILESLTNKSLKQDKRRQQPTNTSKYELTDRQDTATPPCTSLRPGAGYCRQCFDKANETGSRTKEANENRTKTKTGGSKENERFGCRYGQQRQNSDS